MAWVEATDLSLPQEQLEHAGNGGGCASRSQLSLEPETLKVGAPVALTEGSEELDAAEREVVSRLVRIFEQLKMPQFLMKRSRQAAWSGTGEYQYVVVLDGNEGAWVRVGSRDAEARWRRVVQG